MSKVRLYRMGGLGSIQLYKCVMAWSKGQRGLRGYKMF